MRHQNISPEKIRAIFNRERYWEKVGTGEYTDRVVYHKHRSPPAVWLPVCTYSQRVAYYDEHGTKIAEVHQYLQPDGTIGASGRPDPKQILYKGVVYHVIIAH